MKQTKNKCNCGCDQLLTEINYIRDVEQPAAESELQNALYKLDHLMDALRGTLNVNNNLFESDEYINCEELIRDRYVRSVRTIHHDGYLPF